MSGKISIIIVNFNGKKWLKDCLGGLSKQTYKNYEIIFVDNGSSDGSVDFVKSNFTKVKLVLSKVNLGFAGGNNLGIKKVSGDYVLLINNDAKVDSDYLEKFIQGFEKHPKAGIIQSKIVWMNDPSKIDSCGSYWTDTSFLYYIGNGKDASLPKYNTPFQVFSVKGASIMVKKEMIRKIGLFDEDFWSYYEETDMCHRAWLSGYEVWYWPKAVCFHANGGTSLGFNNNFIQFHNFKNKLSSFIKNFEPGNLIYAVMCFLIFNIAIGIVWIFRGKIKNSISLVRALSWNLKNIHKTLNKRKDVQKSRVTGDSFYLSKVKHNPGYSYYYYLINDKLGSYQD